MPTRRKASPRRRKTTRRARKPASTRSGASKVSAIASAQLKTLRKAVKQLRSRLKKETNGRSLDAVLMREAKKAREGVSKQISALKQQGVKLSRELRRALSDTDRHEAARQQALSKIAQLRAELARRTEELTRKSEELAKLALESAGRAREIIMSEAAEGTAGEKPKEP